MVAGIKTHAHVNTPEVNANQSINDKEEGRIKKHNNQEILPEVRTAGIRLDRNVCV